MHLSSMIVCYFLIRGSILDYSNGKRITIVVDQARSDEEAEERESTWRKAETSCELIKIDTFIN